MLDVKPGTLPCVWFNPLYFQSSNQIWSGLAHAMLHQLADQLESRLEKERFWFRLRLTRVNTNAIRREIHKLVLERMLPKGLVWAGLLVSMLAVQLFGDSPVARLLNAQWWLHGLPVIGAMAHGLVHWLNKNRDWSLDDKLVRFIREPDYKGDLGLLHLVEHDLDRALTLLLGQGGRLVIFIDDLDRCSPDTVSDILLAINQFISVQQRKLYFILGMDTHMVAMAIETAAEKQAATYNKNRHTSKGYGWRFMEKFVQVPFFIPRMQRDRAEIFLSDMLQDDVGDVKDHPPIKELKQNIVHSRSPSELQQILVRFKKKHKVDAIPEVGATVASKMIKMTGEQDSETLNQLIAAAMDELELNPREMKRFLNVARLLFIRADHQEDISSHAYMLTIVRASHLVLNWPQCLRWLQGNARSFTLQGEKKDPVVSLHDLFDAPDNHNFDSWCKAIEGLWGECVAQTVAQPDFYAFAKRIHENPPDLVHIFEVGIF